jgi:hypothetical protein
MRWFKHMSNMSQDVKIKRLIRKFGVSGYGLYNYILEMIVRKLEPESPLPELEESAEDIASDLSMDTLRVEEIIIYCLNQGLFEQDEVSGRILANKIYKFLDQKQTRNPQIKGMIHGFIQSKIIDCPGQSGTVGDIGGTVGDCPDLSAPDQIRLDQIRSEEIREEQVKETAPSKPILITIQGRSANKTRYDNLVREYGQDVFDTYADRVIAYEDSLGKRKYKDLAATVQNWINRDRDKGSGPVKVQAAPARPVVDVAEEWD